MSYILNFLLDIQMITTANASNFTLFPDKKRWTKAGAYCREKGGSLANISTQSQHGEVKELLNGGGGHYWIGQYQGCQSDGIKKCCVIKINNHKALDVSTKNCNNKRGFVCEKKGIYVEYISLVYRDCHF